MAPQLDMDSVVGTAGNEDPPNNSLQRTAGAASEARRSTTSRLLGRGLTTQTTA